MKSLLELVRIITKSKMRHIKVLGQNTEKESEAIRLYEALFSGKVTTDEEALDYLYGRFPRASHYRNLKSGLKQQLLDSLFFINLSSPSLNKQEKAYFQCQKDWAAVKILLKRGARKIAIDLAQKTLRKALQFDFTELVVQSSQVLRFHYGSRAGDMKKMQKYSALHKRYSQAWFFESLAEEYYTLLVSNYVNERSVKEKQGKAAITYYEELKGPMQEFPTYRLLLLTYLIRIIACRSFNDYHGTVVSCEEAIQAFKAKDYEVKTPVYTFLHQQILAHIQLQQFALGECTARKAAQLIPQGTTNWFINTELLLLLAMHTRRYQQAWLVYQEATGHRGFQKLREIDKEQWLINGAYIHFLIEVGKITISGSTAQTTKFRLGRFLNQVPVFSKDKQGMNVAILIIQVLFLIIKKRYSQAIDRIEAINKYRVRYLYNNKALRRSNYFIKMLLQIPGCSFHKAAVLRKSERYYRQLRSIPLEIANQTHGIELIPYEDLWELALSSLEPRFYQRRGRRVEEQQ